MSGRSYPWNFGARFRWRKDGERVKWTLLVGGILWAEGETGSVNEAKLDADLTMGVPE